MLKHVDLCSGIGGFALAFQTIGLSKPVMFCDIEPWSRKVLSRHWPDVPITEDVKALADDPERNVPDCQILSAGYPCQPFSLASKNRKGTEDERHIWPYIKRIISAKRPDWCVFENVRGHITNGLDAVINDLHSENYTAIPMLLPAYSVGAIHERARIYIVAHANDRRCTLRGDGQLQQDGEVKRTRLSDRRGAQEFDTGQWRQIESRPYGVADGIPNRVDRNTGLGNAIVPQIAMNIGLTIKEMI
tara:strand:+ start:1310 stop:2047 length:738 start_codon:yes stop_codon:yes gene_type:complete